MSLFTLATGRDEGRARFAQSLSILLALSQAVGGPSAFALVAAEDGAADLYSSNGSDGGGEPPRGGMAAQSANEQDIQTETGGVAQSTSSGDLLALPEAGSVSLMGSFYGECVAPQDDPYAYGSSAGYGYDDGNSEQRERDRQQAQNDYQNCLQNPPLSAEGQALVTQASNTPRSAFSAAALAQLDAYFAGHNERLPATFLPGSYIAYGMGLGGVKPTPENGFALQAALLGYLVDSRGNYSQRFTMPNAPSGGSVALGNASLSAANQALAATAAAGSVLGAALTSGGSNPDPGAGNNQNAGVNPSVPGSASVVAGAPAPGSSGPAAVSANANGTLASGASAPAPGTPGYAELVGSNTSQNGSTFVMNVDYLNHPGTGEVAGGASRSPASVGSGVGPGAVGGAVGAGLGVGTAVGAGLAGAGATGATTASTFGLVASTFTTSTNAVGLTTFATTGFYGTTGSVVAGATTTTTTAAATTATTATASAATTSAATTTAAGTGTAGAAGGGGAGAGATAGLSAIASAAIVTVAITAAVLIVSHILAVRTNNHYKEDDTKLANEMNKEIFTLVGGYNANRASNPDDEAKYYQQASLMIGSVFDQVSKYFKRPESTTSQWGYVSTMLKSMQDTFQSRMQSWTQTLSSLSVAKTAQGLESQVPGCGRVVVDASGAVSVFDAQGNPALASCASSSVVQAIQLRAPKG